MHILRSTGSALLLASISVTAFAGDSADAERAAMQKQLNAQVMSAPFNPGDTAKAEAYSEDAKKQGVAPVMQAPSYWAPGWTCANLAAYQYYAYNDYRNCYYYHYYYHRYW